MKIKHPKCGCENCEKEWIPRSEDPPSTCPNCESARVYAELPDGVNEYRIPYIKCSCGHKWYPRTPELPDKCRECLTTDYVLHQPDGNTYKIKPTASQQEKEVE